MLTAGVAASSPRFCAMSNLQSPPLLASSGASFLSSLLGLGFHSLKFNSIIARKTKPLSIRAAKTESKRVSLGFRAPDFQLLEPLTGKIWTLQDFEVYPALLVMFICNHCPFVIHLKKDFVKLSNFYMKKGLAVVAISSNSVATHPQDGPEFMAEDAKVYGYPFPYLYDEGEVSVLPLCIATLGSDNIKPNLVDVRGSVARVADQADLDESQDIARDFEAVCTPEFFLFKKDGRRPFELVYHGQFDDSRPSNNVAITGRDLSMAIDSVLSGQPVNPVQKPSVGCSIKWHPEVKQ